MPEDFAKRLWGDVYFNDKTRKFQRTPADSKTKRTFVHFILEPLYKLYAQVVGEEGDALKRTLEGLGIMLKPAQYKANTRELLRLVLQQFFGDAAGFVSMVVRHTPSPQEAAAGKVWLRTGGQ